MVQYETNQFPIWQKEKKRKKRVEFYDLLSEKNGAKHSEFQVPNFKFQFDDELRECSHSNFKGKTVIAIFHKTNRLTYDKSKQPNIMLTLMNTAEIVQVL